MCIFYIFDDKRIQLLYEYSSENRSNGFCSASTQLLSQLSDVYRNQSQDQNRRILLQDCDVNHLPVYMLCFLAALTPGVSNIYIYIQISMCLYLCKVLIVKNPALQQLRTEKVLFTWIAWNRLFAIFIFHSSCVAQFYVRSESWQTKNELWNARLFISIGNSSIVIQPLTFWKYTKDI
jgi:hypothetical protein